MKKIVLDTNFLMAQFEDKVDLASELRRITNEPISLVVSSGTINELKTLAGRVGKRSTGARFVLQHFDRLRAAFGVEIIPNTGAVDGWIIKYAQENNVCVATNDVPLRKRLLAMDVSVIAVKGRSKLDFV